MGTKFTIAALPELHFGQGKIAVLPDRVLAYGKRVLLVTGSRSFTSSAYGEKLLYAFRQKGIDVRIYKIESEPSPAIVDDVVEKNSSLTLDCVVAIGGGSVLDAGKAISAMLPLKDPVKIFLEGVGHASHPGVKIPFIAIPTTSGTGSEATKNAVLSETGPGGFKKSLRHSNFVPNVAIVDPELALTCSPDVTAASGMDAFTQLLESYLSTTANPFTDALALQGLTCISKSLLEAFHDGSNLPARTDMALASYLSGVTLANAGLGLVHGFASVIGGWYPVSHGVICSVLMPEVNRVTVRKLRELKMTEPLARYAIAGKLFITETAKTDDYYIDAFLELQARWKEELAIPKLREVVEKDMARIAKESENKNNPAELDEQDRLEILSNA